MKNFRRKGQSTCIESAGIKESKTKPIKIPSAKTKERKGYSYPFGKVETNNWLFTHSDDKKTIDEEELQFDLELD